MKKFIILTLAASVYITINAQSPGYLGKKFSLSYNPAFSPAFYGGNPYVEVKDLGINYRHDFEAEYVISRGLSLSPGVKFLSTKMFNLQMFAEDYDYYDKGFSGDARVKSTSFSLKLKNYSYKKRGSIAPVGKYKSFEFLITKSKAETLRYFSYYTGSYSETFTIRMDVEDFNYEVKNAFGIIFGTGSQNIYFDKLLIDTGWEVGIILPYLFTGISRNPKNSGESYSEENFSDLINARVAGTYFLNFTVGFGYLIL